MHLGINTPMLLCRLVMLLAAPLDMGVETRVTRHACIA